MPLNLAVVLRIAEAQPVNEAGYQLDALNIQLDELIAKVEADIRRSPLTQYRLKKAKQIGEPD